MSKWLGLLGRLNFLQDWVSSFITSVNPMVYHTIEKYFTISKIIPLSMAIPGDYLEFGVFRGSSLCHAIKAYKRSLRYMEKNETTTIRFFGFDSFEGFGKLNETDIKGFDITPPVANSELAGASIPQTDQDFTTSLKLVQKRANRYGKGVAVNLVKGFYSDTLKDGPASYGISKVKVIFIDCDTYTAAKDAFDFCTSIVQQGTIIVLDDRLMFHGDPEAGESKALRDFLKENKLEVRKICYYGIGSAVYMVSKCF